MIQVRDRADPAYAKPENYDEMVRAARQAAQNARAAGADDATIRLSAKHAAFQIAGLRPVDDPWQDRLDRD